MLTLGFSGRILVAGEPVDGPKGIDSLSGIVRSVLQGNPISGDLLVFKNRRGDKLKILAWIGDEFALYLHRKKYDDAVRVLRKAAETTDSPAGPLLLLAETLIAKGEWDEARRYFDQAKRLAKSDRVNEEYKRLAKLFKE